MADGHGEDAVLPSIDETVPHSARIWNYWLGGRDNYAVDRVVGDGIRRVNPEIVEIAVAQRAFLCRAVRHLAAEAGVRQFLDIGTGLPTVDNTHEVAQRAAPEARVVYVDNDPLVLVHARALLTSTPEGATRYLYADARDTGAILDGASQTLDLSEPVALMLLGVTGHITDDQEAQALVTRLMDGLSPGSHLVLCDDTEVVNPRAMRRMIEEWNATGDSPRVNRTPDQLARFFDGLELLDPGLLSISHWRPDPDLPGTPAEVDDFGGVARKP
ncbi:SAM-dependent methyltransferase [Streptomyces iconiensis]|uniref:SAM-dependent methyltransferase n=1 Tax=Streptomyces iconiensis TaxID=1384038 RepID=A0ABT7A764_9ACTN|nr:SAM-dependent methyltransferase [Streptomyces iconiensis]MDJ1137168.1 SAM-dependent methyltransferase [Streptomyces iconiensis]